MASLLGQPHSCKSSWSAKNKHANTLNQPLSTSHFTKQAQTQHKIKMNKSIAIVLVLAAVAFAVASATVGYRQGPYQPYPYQAGYYGPSYGPSYGASYSPYYRGYSSQVGVAPAYSSYQPYYSSYQPYYSNYYGPSYYPYASSRA